VNVQPGNRALGTPTDRSVALLPIGRFARLSGLTVKALRHYDALGLLSPTQTDPATRHRWYSPDQLEPARRIRRLRELDLPLPAIRAVLAASDGGRELLIAYRRDVEARLAHDQRILHGLVHLIEGDDMSDTTAPSRLTTTPGLPDSERQLAADLFNLVWTLLEQPGRTTEDDDRMVHAAHASRYHWGQVGGPEQFAIGEWQCARVYSVLGRAEPALHHARRCLEIATAGAVPDWLIASAHEGVARAYAVAGQRESALASRAAAEAALAKVTDAEDRQVVQDDLASLPL
jgi:DNA-binding transcriptional MerR regulator